MKAKKRTDNFWNPFRELHRQTTLTIKMVILTVLVGIALWVALDFVLTNSLKNFFQTQLTEQLSEHTSKDNELIATVISRVRHERAVTAITLIAVFAMIMYWITRSINKISWHISYFSESFLGLKPSSQQSGDQLYALKERFHEMTKEIIDTRKIIKMQAEETTRHIVNGAFDAIVTTDDNGIISTWNPTAGELFGWTSEEALGKPIYDVIAPPELQKEYMDTIQNIIDKNKGQNHKCLVLISAYHRSGRKMSVEFSISSARQEKSSIFIFIMRDTTERGRAEKKIQHLLMTLKKSKDEWEKTFDTVIEQILLVDKNLNIIKCNKSFAESIKSSDNELIGKKFYEFMICDQDWLSAIKEKREQPKRIEIKTYDGHWLYVSVLPVYDKQGLFLYMIVTATDITELKSTQQTLMESKEELNERVDELESFYDMAVNRELKMINLKKEVQKLESKNGNGNNGATKEDSKEAPDNLEILNKKTQEQTNQPALSYLDDISPKR
ncbi:MAG TPA: PAS domain S-box protein [Nitrospirae bacterium]|nr:oxygen sensor protein DosP [bacterium BMS3Abin09]GBE40750.1 oxygen sensor protein DosP [bacterium BMS3Bbin09]HDO26199.1 PAS domain S-box protein [Nitrospirota bacterium]HDZ84358.1 PAS domain S-box protein [Nitrospirota bacterium]